jgi:hypothetical protein
MYSPGMVGAALANLVNEAALLAVRQRNREISIGNPNLKLLHAWLYIPAQFPLTFVFIVISFSFSVRRWRP